MHKFSRNFDLFYCRTVFWLPFAHEFLPFPKKGDILLRTLLITFLLLRLAETLKKSGMTPLQRLFSYFGSSTFGILNFLFLQISQFRFVLR